MGIYSEKVMDHFQNPRNMGELADADAVGKVGNPVCGDVMNIYIKVEDNRVSDISFKTMGCAAAIATSSMVTELAKGKTLEEAEQISRNDVAESLDELHRVVKPGGRIHVMDSDWGFVIVEPWGKDTVDRFFAAAAPAFREPHIGRKLPAALTRAGFRDIEVRMLPIVDRDGRLQAVLRNMQSYIRTFATLPEAEVADLMRAVESAVADGTYFACLPQFLVTATR